MSDSEDENIIRYGTPLDPYEEDEVPSKRKFQDPADQYAVDADGRRRFHGAFTGGFSAGYGNTVGLPEGWTPSTFKSSRREKAQISNQKPEDFMDEEDRSEYGIAPRQLQTSNEFSGRKRASQKRFHDGPIPGEPVLEQLLRPVHEPAAVRMLRAMGWREGQGTGARVTRQERRTARQRHKVYGCYMPEGVRQNTQPESEESSDSEFEYDTLFAPDDYEPYILKRKDDRFGLGYTGLSRHSVLGNLVGEYGEAGSSRSHLLMNDKGRKVSIRGQAFGVGAFETEDDDVYATEDMSHYDFALGGEHVETKKKVEKSSGVLEGFVKATKPLPAVPSYPPPVLPRDYVPAPAGSRRSRFEPSEQPQRDQGLGRHELTAEARGKLLGETSLPDPAVIPNKSTISTTSIKIIDFTAPAKETQADKAEDYISIKDSGKEVPKVFKPFASNPQKQMRYEKFLKDKDSLVVEEESNMDRLSEWEKNREAMEFEQAAKLYKPLSGVMNDRFTHASEPDDAINPLTAVARSTTNYGLATPEQIEAAKIGAYGVLTRRETPWRPEPLVCKRFNVPEIGGTRPEPVKEDKPKLSYSIFSYLESSVHDKESFTKEQSKFSGSKSVNTDAPKDKPATIHINQIIHDKNDKITESSGPVKRMTVAELFLKESEKDLKNKDQGVEVTETIEKFDKMDLYKSIFLSDSENEEEISKPKDKDINNDSYEDFVDKPKNIERNNSPPRGIFANIDFDELNSWKRKADDKNTDTTNNDKTNNATSTNKVEKVETANVNEKPQTVDESIQYGPKLPDSLVKRLESVPEETFKPTFRSKDERENDSSSDSDSWVEAKEVKSKKSRKEKKKHKKHKSKHKKSKSKKKDR